MKLIETPSMKGRLLAGTVIPVALGVGLAMAPVPAAAASPLPTAATKAQPWAAATRPGTGIRATEPLPAAVPKPVQLAACGAKKGCGACGAKKGCGACGAKKGCGACGACGAGGAVSASCVIPRLAKANPCAAKKGCGAKKACGACGAKKACGACGAKKACGACGAAKKGCGACGAAKKGCGACGACGACGGKPAVKITNAEAAAAYDCLLKELKAAYAKSGNTVARAYARWKRYSKRPYPSATHGNRLVSNYGNRAARRYINYEKVKRMPAGSVLAKDSFLVQADGKLALGPLFVMEKMARGWNAASRDWKYTMITPDGKIAGTTRGKGAAAMKFCYECHNAAAERDALFFLPKAHRVAR
jgi:hypothetical protein